MRKTLLAAAFLALVTPMFAAADFSGTWKLNTQTSTGPEQATETQLVAVIDGNTQTITVTRTTIDGKPAMHIQSVLSADGKTMTTTRTVTAGPMKPGTYTDIWERQS